MRHGPGGDPDPDHPVALPPMKARASMLPHGFPRREAGQLDQNAVRVL
jgi:hypothetical protein